MKVQLKRVPSVSWRLPEGWCIVPDLPEFRCALDAMRTWLTSSQLPGFAESRHGYGNTDMGHGVTYPSDLDEFGKEVDQIEIPQGYVQVYSFFGPPDGEEYLLLESVYLDILSQFLAGIP